MPPAKKTSTSSSTVRPKRSRRAEAPTAAVTAEDIARRAYEIYESRGRTDGGSLEDWLEAERQLLGTGA